MRADDMRWSNCHLLIGGIGLVLVLNDVFGRLRH